MSHASLSTFFDQPPDDLTACDREPIHVPGAIQAHGLLVVFSDEMDRVLQVSENVQHWLGQAPGDVLGQPPEVLFGQAATLLRARFARPEAEGTWAGTIRVEGPEGARDFDATAHRNEAGLVVEMEPAGHDGTFGLPVLAEVESIVRGLERAESVQAWCQHVARRVQQFTGFGRVMVYRFDADWHGQVVAEAREAGVASFLDLYFPASDIPRQARHLYVLNPIRYIADVAYTPVAVVPERNPVTNAPLDLSHSLLRSVSPVHIEYLRNMQVGASMSISIIQDGQLWGLVACHHPRPHPLPQPLRSACSLLGRVLSLQLPQQQQAERSRHARARFAVQQQLLEKLRHAPSISAALTPPGPTPLDLIEAQGAAIVEGEVCNLIGQTPAEPLVRRVVAYLAEHAPEGLFATDRLPALLEEPALRAHASGLLALPLGVGGRDWLLWFRHEKLRSVVWAGDHTLASPDEDAARLSPRKSFAQWKELVQGTAAPWQPGEQSAAEAFHSALVEVMLQRADETARLNRELAQANRALELSNRELQEFASVVAHDLKEPMRKISMLAGLLDSDFAGAVPEEGRFFLRRLQQAALRMTTLVSDMLALSQAKPQAANMVPTDLNDVMVRVQQRLYPEIEASHAQVEVGPLPVLMADRAQMVRMLQHLVANAIKFQPPGQVPVVRVAASVEAEEEWHHENAAAGPAVCLTVADNGLGFEPRHAARIFKPFQRLHTGARYEGNGIGLALCRRIAEWHGGYIKAAGTPGKGSVFTVCLPLQPRQD